MDSKLSDVNVEKLYNGTSTLEYFGYGEKAERDFLATVESEGFQFRQGQFGGTAEEIIQILSHFNLRTDSVAGVIIYSILANILYDLLKKLGAWWTKHGKSEKGKPVIVVHIYNQKTFKHHLILNIDRKYSKDELRQTLSEAEDHSKLVK